LKAIIIASPARRDIDRLLASSRKAFGEAAADRYRSLILRGLMMIRDEPTGAKTHPLKVARPGIFSLHLRAIESQVRRPRHRLIHTVKDQTVVVLRALHDRMDIDTAFR
jgi:plasmid stabilization system protein ParE